MIAEISLDQLPWKDCGSGIWTWTWARDLLFIFRITGDIHVWVNVGRRTYK